MDHSSESYKKSDTKLLSNKSSTSSLSVFPSSTPTTTESPYKTSEFYIIRVSVEGNGPETEGKIQKQAEANKVFGFFDPTVQLRRWDVMSLCVFVENPLESTEE